MDFLRRLKERETRREFLVRSAQGMGTMALASLLNGVGFASLRAQSLGPKTTVDRWPGIISPPHVAPRAKRIIYLYMAGGPSHLETLDYKPTLAAMHGKPMPASITAGQQLAQLQGQQLNCLGPQAAFRRFGESGQMMSEYLPHIGQIADDICIVRSMQTEQINHDPAHTFMNTGSMISGRPSMGSWMLYGLGSESENLPGFIVMTSEGGGQGQPIAARQWHSGFLPGRFQGVQFQSTGDPVNYVELPDGVDISRQRELVNTIRSLNEAKHASVEDPAIQTRIAQYEMAFRMQASVPDLVDFSDEPQAIKDLYGTEGADGTFAANCLLARRLAERGVRFIQLYHRGWDHHGSIKEALPAAAKHVDRASAALIIDLKQRGMLEDTLVIWGGEFGRTPMAQGSGRDHHIKGFSLWMAGGGVRGGMSYGKTDDFGFDVVENPVHVHDLHATILHIMGIDHEKLTYRYQGRDFRLTDVHGHVVHDILT
ncbi:MAG: DUF1501 domain-containing protein [Bacteroidetes bacterium SB0662_bin_6]|nr:DUF1501 domain-containing protein [Bacteroidetes bacterium SB0668_bin_1]MYE03696.1 DUF1501 domain-containing protein [Bacteroidetes bacterium SB0662_bin_6]